MTRKCSHCNLNGHNSRTCPNRGGGVVKLFGVNLSNGGSIRKCVSMGNLVHYAAAAAGGSSPAADAQIDAAPAAEPDGYASEDLAQGSSSASRERKKGVPWTEDEHRMFLLGLQKLGKGDWRGIARNFVVSRTPTQVASHAQKYFIRQTNASRRKRRSSLFDIVPDESIEDLQPVPMFQESDARDTNPLPEAPPLDEECESMDSTNSNDVEAITPKPEISQYNYPMVYPSYFSSFVPFPIPIWSSDYQTETHEEEKHEIIKPTAMHPKMTPLNVEELVGMSTLSLRESHGESVPSFIQLGGPDRQSAFRAQPTARSSDVT